MSGFRRGYLDGTSDARKLPQPEPEAKPEVIEIRENAEESDRDQDLYSKKTIYLNYILLNVYFHLQ